MIEKTMPGFHYKCIKVKDKAKILFSFYHIIETEKVYEDFYKYRELFAFNN